MKVWVGALRRIANNPAGDRVAEGNLLRRSAGAYPLEVAEERRQPSRLQPLGAGDQVEVNVRHASKTRIADLSQQLARFDAIADLHHHAAGKHVTRQRV